MLDAPGVLLLGLTLPGKDRDTGSSDSSGGVVLGREDVARRPGDLGTEVGKGLDEDGTADLRDLVSGTGKTKLFA